MKLEPEEQAPCGAAGLINYSPRPEARDVSDCLVSRPKPHRLIIWEPLHTKAPNPNLTLPFCCYVRTVIFYVRPYHLSLHSYGWRDRAGAFHISQRGFAEWDRLETRLSWSDALEFEGDRFEVLGGTVRWANKRWWMLRSARRAQEQRSAA
jgi:hypothetical protein